MKVCIFLISARKDMLKESLSYLDKNYNSKYNHDIIISVCIGIVKR